MSKAQNAQAVQSQAHANAVSVTQPQQIATLQEIWRKADIPRSLLLKLDSFELAATLAEISNLHPSEDQLAVYPAALRENEISEPQSSSKTKNHFVTAA